jgi:starch-binding outer membrane protein, SusD/RagB family
MIMKKYFQLLLFGIVGLTACKKDLLDTSIQQNFDEALFLNSGFDNLKALGMGVYNYLPQQNGYGGNAMLAAASDEADYARFGSIQNFNIGAWSPFSNPNDVFGYYYRAIRHANLFLEKTVEFRSMIVQDTILNKQNYIINVDDFVKLRAEVRFLRAYYYMELMRRYGGVPIITKTINEQEALVVKRNTFQECANFVAAECDSVYPDLTNHYINYGIPTGGTVGRGDAGTDNNRLGRVEKPAALALKQRILLYAASPLFNTGGSTIWEQSAAAGQQIFSDPACVHVNFLNTSYRDLFMSQNTTNNLTPRKGANSGIILTRPFDRTSDAFERANYPAGMVNGGQGATCPSQNLVDAFEMRTTGLPITNPASGFDPNNPYANRDPRLGFIVVLNGSNMGINTNNTPRVVESFAGGADGIGVRPGATTTGYYLRKMCVENYDLTRTNARAKSWILMRYAEVLLNFAEAMNEAYGPEAKPSFNGVPFTRSAREAINLVRARATMPAIPAGITQQELRQRIQNERRVELAFEEHRFFDVRRWKIAEQTESAPLMGMRVVRNPDNSFSFQRFEVEKRVFDAKMYLYPIPFDEISKSNGNLTQNPGW